MSIFEPAPEQEPVLMPKLTPEVAIPSYIGADVDIYENCLFHVGSGDTLYDYSGRGNHCTIGPDLSWESEKKWFLRFPNSGAVTTPFTATDMHDFNGGTFLFWHKYDTLTGARNCQGNPCFGVDGWRGFQCGIGNGTDITAGNLGLFVYDGTANNLDSGFSPSTGEWYCIAVKYGSVCGGMAIIVNGDLKNSNGNTAIPATVTNKVLWGGANEDVHEGLQGWVMFYNSDLPLSEIREFYDLTKHAFD